MTVRELREEDLKAVSEMHYREIKDSFLCSLGQDFLFELYDSILNSKNTLSYVFEEDARVIGFISGTLNYRTFFRKALTSKWNKFLPILFKKILREPNVVFRSAETLLYSRRADVSVEAEILSVVVDGRHRRKNVGSMLLNHLLSEFAEKGVREVKVVVDEENDAGNRFYKKNGFLLTKSLIMYDKNMNVYVCDTSYGKKELKKNSG